ncbi:YdeI/OmpD-associated family protein [Arthrobacter sp. SAFR-179]|uniref:YdeI/OmpD-associated family protein n=1 Tax=Arthrobacter sp. SAFR-179 TaxID=3387279 RepID=UPI003F7C2A31
MAVDLEELLVPDAAAWRAWLEENHKTSPGVWLVLHKKGGTVTALDYPAALDEALCFGWIDGQLRRRDDESSFQRMTPRRPRSVWSARNVGHVARLEEAGKMTDAGRAAVEAAKADGRWDAAYGGQADLEVPADLAAAIAANPAAQAMFDVLTKTNLFALVYRTNSAKQAATRERRIAGFVDMLARGETPFPQKKRPAGQD